MAVVTVLDELKIELNDRDAKFMSDAEYKREIYKRTAQENTYVFQKVTTGIYAYMGGDKLYLLNPTFTSQAGVTYTTNASGSIEILTGTDTRTTINVTGARVDFREVVCAILMRFATHRCKEISESGQWGSITPEEVYQKCMTMLQNWRGSYSIC